MNLEPELSGAQLDAFIKYATIVLQARDASADMDVALEEFLVDVYTSGFVVSYDWPQYYAENKSLLNDAAALQAMDLDSFRRIVIAHLRMDRFSEGHLRHLLDTGYFAALVERASQLRSSLRGTP